jgi:hypothetical protein
MKLGAKNAKTGWKAVSLAVVCALMLGPLTACDEDVDKTLVTGLNAMAVTLVNAAFQSFTPDGIEGNNLGTDRVQ